MKRFVSVGTLVLALAACGGGGSGSGDTEPAASTVAPSTTVAGMECTSAAASRDVGVEVELFPPCVEGWASAQDSSYLATCGDCESVLLLHWVDAQWKVALTCNQYEMLSVGACSSPTSSPSWPAVVEAGATVPALDVACRIWEANTRPENIVSGGCFGPPSSLRYDDIPRCDSPLSPEGDFPIYICSKGKVVKSVQAALRAEGYSLTADSYFGVDTLKALISYQKAKTLPVDGTITFDVLVNLGIADPSEGDY